MSVADILGSLPPVDIILTTYPKNSRREELSLRSVASLKENTDLPYRVTMVVDGSEQGTGVKLISSRDKNFTDVIIHQENRGLGPSVNEAMACVQSRNLWHQQRGEFKQVSDFVCYVQDDIEYEKKWLSTLMQWFVKLERQLNLGFATGAECPEHETKSEVGTFDGRRIITKDWIRMTQMFARREYFASMFPIPGMDPETGQKRARPNDGMGSGCDWWLVRNHPNSVCKTGRTNLVMPGLVRHIGYADSTWLDRELPESSADREKMCGA